MTPTQNSAHPAENATHGMLSGAKPAGVYSIGTVDAPQNPARRAVVMVSSTAYQLAGQLTDDLLKTAHIYFLLCG
jgi:hypothetical protein